MRANVGLPREELAALLGRLIAHPACGELITDRQLVCLEGLDVIAEGQFRVGAAVGLLAEIRDWEVVQ